MYRPPLSVTATYNHPSVFILAAAVLFSLATSAPAQPAVDYEELPKFAQVTERLYRGAQPRQGGIRRLTELGFNTVINLRGANARTRMDQVEAEALGLRYFNIPLPRWGRPQDDLITKILNIIMAPESGRVLVHCKDGVDRTGMVIALNRIAAEGWSAKDATAEARNRGMRGSQIWMRDYISDYEHNRQVANGGTLPGGAEKRDFSDRLGAYARVGERATFKARKATKHALQRAPKSAVSFLEKIF